MNSILIVQRLSFGHWQTFIKVHIKKSTHQKFISKKEVPNQTLKQKRFHEHYFTESHTSIDTLKELKPKSRKIIKSYSGLSLIQLPLIRTST